MQFGFEVVAAKPKRLHAEHDEPTFEPMRPREVANARTLTPEQKKIRRQMTRSHRTASSGCSACRGTGEQGNGHECYICDGTGLASEEKSGRAAGVTNDNPANDLPRGIDHGRTSGLESAVVRNARQASALGDIARGLGGAGVAVTRSVVRNNPLFSAEFQRHQFVHPFDMHPVQDDPSDRPDPKQIESERSSRQRLEQVRQQPQGTHPAPGQIDYVPNPFNEGRETNERGVPYDIEGETHDDTSDEGYNHVPGPGPHDLNEYDQPRRSGLFPRQATQFSVRADALTSGSQVLMPTGQTVKVLQVRPHETSGSMVYVDTDQGTTVVPRTTGFMMVTTNNAQQELPGYGVPGGNSNSLPGSGAGPTGQGGGDNSLQSQVCPNCGRNGTLRREGQTFHCSNCGYSGSFGGPGGHSYGDSSSSVQNFGQGATAQDIINSRASRGLGMSAIARRAHGVLATTEEIQ